MSLIRARHLWLLVPALLAAAVLCRGNGPVAAMTGHHNAGASSTEAMEMAPPASQVSWLRPAQGQMQVPRTVEGFEGRTDLYRYALQLQPMAAGGDAGASWQLSRIYEYCATYAGNPEGYRDDALLLEQDRSPGVQALVRARGQVAQRCAGFSADDGLGLQVVTLQRLRAAEAGSLAAEAALLAQGEPLQDSPDYRRALVQRVLASRDPEAYLALSPAMGVAASGDEAYRGYVAGTQFSQLAWQLAACRLGLECGAGSALMASYCANGGICSQDRNQDFSTFVFDAAVPRQGAASLENMVSLLVQGSGAGS